MNGEILRVEKATQTMPECMEALVPSHPATVHVYLRHLRDAGLEEIQWLSLLDF